VVEAVVQAKGAVLSVVAPKAVDLVKAAVRAVAKVKAKTVVRARKFIMASQLL
jgi:hypothetical protein